MALKFLNKKGWHTGSLRNIENVWKAEQKHEAEQKKLEELRKQIHEERERSEFRQLQEQAGLIPKQERLDFLYESGLAVGKGTSGFKALESLPKNDPENAAPSSSVANSVTATAQQSAVPGALFDEKPQSANDTWRKLHSDPLLLIRRREQEALARVKNNPVQMAMIHKSVEAKKKDNEEEKHRKKRREKQSKHRKRSSSKSDSDSEDTEFTVKKQSEFYQKCKKYEESSHEEAQNSDEESSERGNRRKRYYDKQYKEGQSGGHQDTKYNSGRKGWKDHYEFQHQEYSSEQRQVKSLHDNQNGHLDPKHEKSDDARKIKKSRHDFELKERFSDRHSESRHDKQEHISERHSESHYDTQIRLKSSQKPPRPDSNNRLQNSVKLTAEDRAARLREMQMDAEVHEVQRWKRLDKAAESDAQEALRDQAYAGRNFLDTAQKSIYGAEKGGSSTIEESVRRRTHYSQGRSDTDKNAFRR
ncbi:uncharacterized protein LOC142548978 isoform X1 [Primulina tabacum]|uniref:uncharacterized protein LOC142548978 isoform X1 n=1 Tax=Primulina tabacum TaxID=48773 RepID=UPI003F5998FE